MNKYLYILLMAIQGVAFLNAEAQNSSVSETPVLFVDRDYCISGDTVWFKVLLSENNDLHGNVVRVQVESKGGNLITTAAVKCKNVWASGFIHIPDSLSTGQYFLTAFLNSQRNIPDLKIESKSLLVYNRFEEYVTEIEVIEPNPIDETVDVNSVLNISTDKENYTTREKVSVRIDGNPELKMQNAVIKASLIDPLAEELVGRFIVEQSSSDSIIPDLNENDGLLLSGKVTNTNGDPQSGVIVVLSISIEPAYFDYYYTGEKGDFHFYLKNATGKTKVVLQVISKNDDEYIVGLENNSLLNNRISNEEIKILNTEQTEFISTAIESSFASKLFNPGISVSNEDFIFPNNIGVPFYGPATERIVPEEFFDLPDFEEISREILPGVQYREKNGDIAIRLINRGQGVHFDNEPLRMINGIPIFKNNILSGLKSTDIAYVDIVKQERIFGDLLMKGILSVSLYDKSNSWLTMQPNTFQFEVDFLQQERSPRYLNRSSILENHPDIRQNYMWDLFDEDKHKEFEFMLSDRKGKVEITVTGITQDNEFFKSTKIITVQ